MRTSDVVSKITTVIPAWGMILRRAAKSRLAADVLSLYIVQGLNYLTPLLVLPYLLRVLGPVGYGAIAFSQSLVAYMRIFTDFGFNFSATREISVARERPVDVARIFWATLAAKGLLLAVGLLVLLPIVYEIPVLRVHFSVIAVSAVALGGSVVLPQWYFQGLERIRDLAIIQAVCNVFMLAGIVVCIHGPTDELRAAGILALPALLAAGISLVVIRLSRPVSWSRPGLKDVRQALASSWHLFVSGAATSLYVNSNVFLLGLICGDYQVAMYSLANRIGLAGTGILSPMVQASFPRASLLFDRSVPCGLVFVRRLSKYLLTTAIILSIFLEIFARQIVALLGGARFAEAVPAVRIMGLLPVAIGLAMILAQIVMVNIGLTRRLSHIYILAGVINLAMLPPLASQFGAVGGAAALLAVEIVGPILMALSIKRWVGMHEAVGPA